MHQNKPEFFHDASNAQRMFSLHSSSTAPHQQFDGIFANRADGRITEKHASSHPVAANSVLAGWG
jgi:hypothetical protein